MPWFNFLSKSKPTSPKGWDDFYQRFEDRFRGSEAAILERLRSRYEKDLGNLKSSLGQGATPLHLDLGSGRGELLDLTRSLGFQAIGVDSNRAACERTRKRGHHAIHGDCLRYLCDVPSDSLTLVTSLHMIEHCPSSYFWQVFGEVARSLKKNGVFLVETPSLYSLWASARQFYLDPTHDRPVHPEFMRFMAEDSGFASTRILEFDPVQSDERSDLNRLLYAVKDQEPSSPPKAKLAGKELRGLDKWLYGPMDVALWAVR